jgi:hypothetical protein
MLLSGCPGLRKALRACYDGLPHGFFAPIQNFSEIIKTVRPSNFQISKTEQVPSQQT